MNIPNYLTFLRIILVPFFLSSLIYFDPNQPATRHWALSIFLAATLTDALDGFLARRFRWQTKLGTFLDPFADKLLLVCGFLGIASSRAFPMAPPLWAVIVIVFRDLLILGGLAVIFFGTGEITVRPNFLGKMTTFFQMLTIGVILLDWQKAPTIWNITIVLTVASAIVYTIRGFRLLNQHPVSRP